MKFEEIELLAAKKEPLPDHPPLEDIHCYECMQSLYRGFYNKRLTEDEAKKLKQKVKLAFQNAKEMHTRYAAALAQYQEFIRSAGTFRPQILKTLEDGSDHVERLMVQCIAAMCQDKIFEKTALRLLEIERMK